MIIFTFTVRKSVCFSFQIGKTYVKLNALSPCHVIQICILCQVADRRFSLQCYDGNDCVVWSIRVDPDSALYTDLVAYKKDGFDHILLNCSFKVTFAPYIADHRDGDLVHD